MNKLIMIPLTLLTMAMYSSVSAYDCFEKISELTSDADSTSSRVAANAADSAENNATKIEQMIQCLSEELASFEKTNVELRNKVLELEKSVFENFQSSIVVDNVPESSIGVSGDIDANPTSIKKPSTANTLKKNLVEVSKKGE